MCDIIVDEEGFILDVPPFEPTEAYNDMREEVEQYFSQKRETNINRTLADIEEAVLDG